MQYHIFEPILNIVYETMPRDNLLNSACLELFEFIKRENIKPIILHIVENYREKLTDITYVDTFQNLILRYDQMQGYNPDMDTTLFSQDDETPTRTQVNGGQRWQGVKEMDAAEEEYFNTSDDEEDMAAKKQNNLPVTNGTSPITKPLVDYPDDDDDAMDTSKPEQSPHHKDPPTDENPTNPDLQAAHSPRPTTTTTLPSTTPPERLSEKRRREEDEEDELGKLSHTKRRSSSTSSLGSATSPTSTSTNPTGNTLRRKKSFTTAKDSPTATKKIAISLAVKTRANTAAPTTTDAAQRDDGG
jgi:protein phosphatase-4 regulatory subunit 3